MKIATEIVLAFFAIIGILLAPLLAYFLFQVFVS